MISFLQKRNDGVGRWIYLGNQQTKSQEQIEETHNVESVILAAMDRPKARTLGQKNRIRIPTEPRASLAKLAPTFYFIYKSEQICNLVYQPRPLHHLLFSSCLGYS